MDRRLDGSWEGTIVDNRSDGFVIGHFEISAECGHLLTDGHRMKSSMVAPFASFCVHAARSGRKQAPLATSLA